MLHGDAKSRTQEKSRKKLIYTHMTKLSIPVFHHRQNRNNQYREWLSNLRGLAHSDRTHPIFSFTLSYTNSKPRNDMSAKPSIICISWDKLTRTISFGCIFTDLPYLPVQKLIHHVLFFHWGCPSTRYPFSAADHLFYWFRSDLADLISNIRKKILTFITK